MDAKEAAAAAVSMKPAMAVPYHWGDIVGGISDAEEFYRRAKCKVSVLSPGQRITL